MNVNVFSLRSVVYLIHSTHQKVYLTLKTREKYICCLAWRSIAVFYNKQWLVPLGSSFQWETDMLR